MCTLIISCSKSEMSKVKVIEVNPQFLVDNNYHEPDFLSSTYSDDELSDLISDFISGYEENTLSSYELNQALWLTEALMNNYYNMKNGDGGYILDTILIDSFYLSYSNNELTGSSINTLIDQMINSMLQRKSDYSLETSLSVAATDIALKNVNSQTQEAYLYARYYIGRRESHWAFNSFDESYNTYSFYHMGYNWNGPYNCDYSTNNSANLIYQYKYNAIENGNLSGICKENVGVCCCNTAIDITTNSGWPYVLSKKQRLRKYSRSKSANMGREF